MSRKFAVLGLIVLVAMLMTSCAAPQATQAPAQQPAATQAPAATTAPAAPAATEAPAATTAPAATEAPAASGGKASLVIESWRNDDLKIWQDVIIPAFNKHYPDIEVRKRHEITMSD